MHIHSEPPPALALVVDDAPSDRRLLGAWLESERVCWRGADSARSAYEEVATQAYDMVLLDLELGDGDDGLAVLQKLRASAETRDVPVVMITNTPDTPERLRRVFELGADDYLTKPIDPRGLRRTVARILGRRRSARRRKPASISGAMVAHDFNNLLATVLPGLAELRTHVTDDGRAILEETLRTAHQAKAMVRQMIAAKNGASRKERVELRALIEDVVGLCRRTFNASIDVTFEDRVRAPAFVEGHAVDLHRALLNLCTNARDAVMGRAERRIALTLARSGDALAIIVRDTGGGMDPATLARVGEPFFTTKHGGKGTGLGIASTRKIVEGMGGALRVASRVGEGTTFRIELAPTEPPGQLPAKPPPSKVSVKDGPGGPRVLVVDDDDLVRKSVVRVIQRIAPAVDEARGGEEAIDKLASGRFDIVFLDVTMPGMGGREALRVIRDKWPSLLVVMMSGDAADTVGLEKAAMVLQKPLAHEDLEPLLRAATRFGAPR